MRRRRSARLPSGSRSCRRRSCWRSQASGRISRHGFREIVETGSCAYHRELLSEFPASLLELVQLQGLGPKTVALLYKELDIHTLDALEVAAQNGRLRDLKGLGAKKEQLVPPGHQRTETTCRTVSRLGCPRDGDRACRSSRSRGSRRHVCSGRQPSARDRNLRRRRHPCHRRRPLRERTLCHLPERTACIGTRGHKNRASCYATGFRPISESSLPRAAVRRCNTSPGRSHTISPSGTGHCNGASN